jgi:hypothetical protein
MGVRLLRIFAMILLLGLAVRLEAASAPVGKAAPIASPGAVAAPRVTNSSGLEFIDTSFENASPVWYEEAEDGTIRVRLLYDMERESPNRAAGHLHILLHARPGAQLTFELLNLDNVWNGIRASVAREWQTVCISENGRDWRVIPVDNASGVSVRFSVTMTGPRLYVARLEPYRLSDLESFLASIRHDPLVAIGPIGRTVQGRELEIVRVGREDAPYRVFLRARAHPWEPAGNWLVQGLVGALLRGDADARRFLERTCYYILPMANKDGVANGRTRFNSLGKDLNRNWDRPVVQELVPENYALEQWLERMIAAGRKPHLALELHNDGGGRLHLSRPPLPDLARHLERMAVLERLLREHTWFTEGATNAAFKNSGTLGEGWLQRYGIDAVVHEFNANWIAGRGEPPQGRHWVEYGEKLATVLHRYFETVRP